MAYYRFITEGELSLIRRDGCLSPQGHYPPYKPNEIISVFESNDLAALFARYGKSLAELREIPSGKKLIIIEMSGFTGRMEVDQSQGGWPESRAVFEPIPLDILAIIAEAVVQDVRGGQVIFGPLQAIQRARPEST